MRHTYDWKSYPLQPQVCLCSSSTLSDAVLCCILTKEAEKGAERICYQSVGLKRFQKFVVPPLREP